jgi:hypothetical protein
MPDQRRVYHDVDTLWGEWKRCRSDPQRSRELEDAAIRQLLSHQEKQDRPDRALDATGWMRSILVERAEQTILPEQTEAGPTRFERVRTAPPGRP